MPKVAVCTDLCPRVISVIVSLVSKGEGTVESPYYRVRQYHTLEGEFLAEGPACYEGITRITES